MKKRKMRKNDEIALTYPELVRLLVLHIRLDSLVDVEDLDLFAREYNTILREILRRNGLEAMLEWHGLESPKRIM